MVIKSYQVIMLEEDMKKLKAKAGTSETKIALQKAVEFYLEKHK